jgi:ribosomal protein L17
MRHKVAGYKLGRNTAHRRSLLRNLVTSVIVEERVETTVPKAKAAQAHGREDDHARQAWRPGGPASGCALTS